jgi:hypothetical protein
MGGANIGNTVIDQEDKNTLDDPKVFHLFCIIKKRKLNSDG